MYPIEIYLMVVAIDGALSLFSVSEKGADYYKDVAALAFACFLSVYLGYASIAGTASFNGSPIEDAGLMWIWYIVATIQGIFFFLELIEAREERNREKLIQQESFP